MPHSATSFSSIRAKHEILCGQIPPYFHKSLAHDLSVSFTISGKRLGGKSDDRSDRFILVFDC